MNLPSEIAVSLNPRTVFYVLEVIAIVSFALSGLVVARAHKMDVVGTFIAVFLVSFGGGTLRDLLLDSRPFYWIQHTGLLWMTLIISVLGAFVLKISSKLVSNRLALITDAIGLGIFSATGTQTALHFGWPDLPSVMIGVITATFGGLLRDIVCHQKPMLLEDPVPYATCAFLGSWVLIGLLSMRWFDVFWSVCIAATLIAVMRIIVATLDIRMPKLGDEGF